MSLPTRGKFILISFGWPTDIVGNDVGVVNVPVPLPLPTVPILASAAPQVGQKAVIFGYGGTETDERFWSIALWCR